MNVIIRKRTGVKEKERKKNVRESNQIKQFDDHGHEIPDTSNIRPSRYRIASF